MTPPTGLTGADPLYWPCERCRAGSGERCVSITGGRAVLHVNRLRAVLLWRRYGIGGRA
jgi:hypothetical protein